MGSSGSKNIRKLLEAPPHVSLAKKIWNQVDANKNGTLDQNECSMFVKLVYKELVGCKGTLFGFVTDGVSATGSLLTICLTLPPLEPSQRVLDAVFKVLDRNNDGGISYNEFLMGVKDPAFVPSLYKIFETFNGEPVVAPPNNAQLEFDFTVREGSGHGVRRTSNVLFPRENIYLVSSCSVHLFL